MQLDPERTRKALRKFDFQTLFLEELGWDRHSGTVEVNVEGETFALEAAAQKRDIPAFVFHAPSGHGLPDYKTRRKIDAKVAKQYFEHIIVFCDYKKTEQVWQWVRREPGRPTKAREHRFSKGQPGDSLSQKLRAIAVSLEEEEQIDHLTVSGRLRAAFDVEKVTKRFYDRFKKEHTAFLKFIKGIPDKDLQRWYASVMLNRLMFIYFIQKKPFLDGDPDYLRHKLEETGNRKKNQYYRKFLCPLFFEGFAKREDERSKAVNKLLGRVPYLNGGIFQRHQVEELHGRKITIADKAFEKLFTFFEAYRWHLDERPLRKDDEVNPDVLGYIFEKYINQKQMGAYYSKEDITGYISRNTVIPYIFDAARQDCRIAFEGEQSVWGLLRNDPDKYIYDSMKHGITVNALAKPHPTPLAEPQELPPEIAAGVKDVSKRGGWNAPASKEYALPTETWREHVARRRRYEEVKAKLVAGEVREINDLITYNLDIEQFALDAITNAEGPELVRAFWKAITTITVLDPACGSGAFLFAALNILEDLYEASLDRMQSFIDDAARAGESGHSLYPDFHEILATVARHHSPRYFIFKSIIVNNLYGVDIMEEAVEICRLRLFLKLVAQVESVEHVQPLLDIDFNIRAGNTLAGFATRESVRKAVETESGGQGKLLSTLPEEQGELEEIERFAAEADSLFQDFRRRQLDDPGAHEDIAGAKQSLQKVLADLDDRLNRCLAKQYEIDPGKKKKYEDWVRSHKPFHWFVEFYGIMGSGGFGAVIGNPPYVQKNKLKGQYAPLAFRTLGSKDIYAWFVERTFHLASTRGRAGLIVPVSIASSGSFDEARDVLDTTGRTFWMSHFANRPGQLFEGAQNRLTIFLSSAKDGEPDIYGTRYHRWDSRRGEREHLLALLRYECLTGLDRKHCGLYPKTGSLLGKSIVQKMLRVSSLAVSLVKSSRHEVCWVRVPGYFCQFFLEPPMARPENGGKERERGELNRIYLASAHHERVTHAMLNSTSFAVFFWAFSDGRHINPSDAKLFAAGLDRMGTPIGNDLAKLSQRLDSGIHKHKSLWRKSGLLIDTFDSAAVKPIIDEIDRVLARHYGFTDEELDFIINYDIKYRMGRALAGEDDG